jgi:hypothetical protein
MSSRESPLNQTRKEPREKGDNNKQFILFLVAPGTNLHSSLFWPKKKQQQQSAFCQGQNNGV